MIKLIILLIIIVILLYILPKINNRCNSKKKKKNKKNKVRESFIQPFKKEQDFLEIVEGTMCDPNSEQINARLTDGSGMVVQNITTKQLECVPICSLANSNITLDKKNCVECGNSTDDPGKITQIATQRCVEYSEDGMNYTVIEPGNELQHEPNCRYGIDFDNCPACEVKEDFRFNGPNGSCQQTVTVHPPIGKELCTMDWNAYGEKSTNTNIKSYVNDRMVNTINSYTEKLDSPHTFRVPSDQCDRDCKLSSIWAEVRCPTECGQTVSPKKYKKQITQGSLNDGADCLEVAQRETNYNDASYSVEGEIVIKSVPGGCEATLPCCEEGNDNHYNDWTFADGTPVDWNGTDEPKTCGTTYNRQRKFANAKKCINGNNAPFSQTQVKTSKRCCSSNNPNDYTTVYDYTFYDSQGNEISSLSKKDQTSKMDLNKNTVRCKTKVKEVKRYPFKGDECSNSDGASERSPLTTYFENDDECPQDCEVEPIDELTDCPVCKNRATDSPRRTRTWRVIKEQEGGGKTCRDSFYGTTLDEIPPNGIASRLNSTFSTYVECPTNIGVCCNPYEPTHWQSSDTYTKYEVIYDNDERNSGFEVSEDGKASSARDFGDYQNLCNTKVVKTSTFNKTNRCTLNKNDTVESLKPSFSEERLSSKRCPIDCELSVSEFSECSGKCGSGTKTRQWKVTRTPRYGGQTCSNLIYSESDLLDKYGIALEPGERVIGSGVKNTGHFTSEVNCDNVLPCCDSNIEGHFNSNVSGYLSYTPWNNTADYKVYSDDPTEYNWVGSNQQGERLFNGWRDVPCNTTIKKRVSHTPNTDNCTAGDGPYTTMPHEKTNENICPVDCEIQLVEGSSNWSECKDTDGNTLSCRPEGMTPRRERSWMITRMNSETGKTCQEVFTTSKQAGETASNLNNLNLKDTFKSYKDCSSLKPCCDSKEEAHWKVDTVTYMKTTPFNSTSILDTNELPDQDGSRYFNNEVAVPDNTKIKKITSYVQNNETCKDGETEKANDVEVLTNSKVDCELNIPSNWSDCSGNCGDGVQTRNWSIRVEPRINDGGKSCLEVFNSHPSKSNFETPTDGTVPNTLATIFETSIQCQHDKNCCELSQNQHWVVEQNEIGSDKYYYAKYNRTSSSIPEADSILNELTGYVSTEEEFVSPPCEMVVVKFKKVLQNLEECKNGYPSHYQVIELSEGRPTCDCVLAESPSGWNVDECSSMQCKDDDTIYYKTRTWSILHPQEVTGAKTCETVFNAKKSTGEILDLDNITDTTLVSKMPCNRPRCPIHCELSVSTEITRDSIQDCNACKNPGESDGVQKYTWTVVNSPEHGGNSCTVVANNMISDRNQNETIVGANAPNAANSTFETQISCPIRNVCPPTGAFAISQTTDDDDIGTNEFTFTLNDSTNYQNYKLSHSIISVNDNDFDSSDGSIIQSENLSSRANVGTTSISGNNVTVSRLNPETEYKFVLKREYRPQSGISPIYSNPLTITTKPQDCVLSVNSWSTCPSICWTNNSHTQTRTWTVNKAPSYNGKSCSDVLSISVETGEIIPSDGTTLGNTVNSTLQTQKNCGTECGQCGYGSWVYSSGTPSTWDGKTTPPCGKTYKRERTLNTDNCSNTDDKTATETDEMSGVRCCTTTDYYQNSHTNEDWANIGCGTGEVVRTMTLNQSECDNGSNLPITKELDRKNRPSCLATCSATNDNHWDETPTYYLHQPIDDTRGNLINNYDPSTYQLGCNSKIRKNISYTLKSGSCVNGHTTRASSDDIVNINRTPCTTAPTFGTPNNITPTSFKIPIQNPGTYNRRTLTISPSNSNVNARIENTGGTYDIIVTNLIPNTSYTVTLMNTGQDETTASNNIQVQTLSAQDCTMKSYGPWTDCVDVCGGGTQTRNWQITSLANGGQPCSETRWNNLSTKDSDEELVPYQIIDWNNENTTFKTQKSCLSSCGNPHIADVTTCDDESKDMLRTAKIIGIDLNNIHNKTPTDVLLIYAKVVNSNIRYDTQEMFNVTNELMGEDPNRYCYTSQEPSQLLELGSKYAFWIRKIYNNNSNDFVESNKIEKNVCGLFSPYRVEAARELKVISKTEDHTFIGMGINDYVASNIYENATQPYRTFTNLPADMEPVLCTDTHAVRYTYTKSASCIGPFNTYKYGIWPGRDCPQEECDINNTNHYSSNNEYKKGLVSTTTLTGTTDNSINSTEMLCFSGTSPYYECNNETTLSGIYNKIYPTYQLSNPNEFNQPLLDENTLIIEKKTYTRKPDANCQGGQDQSIIYKGKIGPVAPLLQEPLDINITENSAQILLWTNPYGNRANNHIGSLGYHSADSMVSWKLIINDNTINIPNNAISTLTASTTSDVYIVNGNLFIKNLEQKTQYKVKLRKTITLNAVGYDYDSNEITFTTTAAAKPICNITSDNTDASSCCLPRWGPPDLYNRLCPDGQDSCHIKHVQFELLNEDAITKDQAIANYNENTKVIFNTGKGFISNLTYRDIVNGNRYLGGIHNAYPGSIKIYYVLDEKKCKAAAAGYRVLVDTKTFGRSVT